MIIPKNIEIIRDSQFKPVSSKQDFQDEQDDSLKLDRISMMHMTTILLSCHPVQTAPCIGPRKPSCNPVQVL
jgi:hypothetical protein